MSAGLSSHYGKLYLKLGDLENRQEHGIVPIARNRLKNFIVRHAINILMLRI